MSSSNSRALRAAAAVALVGGLLASACSGPASEERPATVSPAHLRPNVLLITIDTLRVDALGAYGRPGSPTPLLDRLAGGGVRFTHAHAHNVVTLPSHANILTGRLPTEHGVRDNAGFRLAPDVETMATHLKRAGYRTGAFVSAYPLDARFGLTAGFDVYDDALGGGSRPAFFIQERPADVTVTRARAWIDAADAAPWFAWVHLYEPHFPYEPADQHRRRWPQDPYLGEVAAADAALAPLLDPVFAAGGGNQTLVLVTSDHGEALGEHGEASHGIFAYESVLRVPLLLHAPWLVQPRVVDAPVQHIDLLPTVLAALGATVPGDLPVRNVLPVAASAGGGDRLLYFEALSANLTRGWAPLTGVLDGRFKYIDLPIPEVYDLSADPREARNLAATDERRTAAFRARLHTIRSPSAPEPQHETADARERLRSLGYTTGRAAPRTGGYTEDDDPKRLIALDGLLQSALQRYLDGDLAGAIEQSRQLVQRRPSMAVAWMQLAQLEREAGRAAAAIDAMRRAVSLRPDDAEPLALLGAYLTEAGRAREAVELLASPAKQPSADPDLLAAFALALARLERFDESISTLQRARAQDPSDARLLLHLGTVQLTRGDRAKARDAFQEVLRIAPDTARAHSSLGVVALEEGRTTEAVEHWRAAGRLDDREYGTVLALGLSLARTGRTSDARACFEFFAAAAPPSRYGAELERVRGWLKGAR